MRQGISVVLWYTTSDTNHKLIAEIPDPTDPFSHMASGYNITTKSLCAPLLISFSISCQPSEMQHTLPVKCLGKKKKILVI